jgi:[protein-PII] uridylyltransferase
VVAFDPSASRRATLLEVIAADRPGLLFDLATAIHQSGSSIDVVLVNTEGHRAIDVFYLTRDGGKLPADVQESLRRRLKEIAAGDFSGPQPIASR